MRIERGFVRELSAGASVRNAGALPVMDFGDALVLPGLVNGHAHLELSGLAGKVPAKPGSSFTDWLQAMIDARGRGGGLQESARWWRDGALDALGHGTTTIADIVSSHGLARDPAVRSIPIRWCPFLEMTGVLSRTPAADLVRDALDGLEPVSAFTFRRGLSPHAPYSTEPALIELAASTARKRNWPWSIHVAESADELDMFRHGRGPLHHWLAPHRKSGANTMETPVQFLDRLGVIGPNMLAVHANYVDDDDVRILGRRSAHVVHCPRSQAFFRHAPFPLRSMRDAGVNVCLGTDSRASLPVEDADLSLFEEMRALRRQHPETTHEEVVRMATLGGARALGAEGVIGELREGARADFAVIPFSGAASDCWEAVVEHRGPVSAVFVGGKPAVAPSIDGES